LRVLALDYGKARCGCAISDKTGTLATPLGAISRPNSERGQRLLRELVESKAVERIVVGLPLSLDGSDTDQTRETREFAEQLSQSVKVSVELYDERLTTRMAERSGGQASEDSRAAAHLLEGWLSGTHPAGGS